MIEKLKVGINLIKIVWRFDVFNNEGEFFYRFVILFMYFVYKIDIEYYIMGLKRNV